MLAQQVVLHIESSLQTSSRFQFFFWDWSCSTAITTCKEAKTGGTEIQGQPGLQSSFKANLEMGSYLKIKTEETTGDID